MDLMKGSTTFAGLKRKYQGMSAPTFRVVVDGVELTEKLKCSISGLAVDLTSGYEASGCSFLVLSQYDYEKTRFDTGGAYKYLQIGAQVEIKLGYISTESVFSGHIVEVEYLFDPEQGAPEIRVDCADAKCLLMKTQRMEILSEKKLTQAVNTLLGEKPVSAYLKGKQVDTLPLEGEMIHFPMESDYDFLVRYAKYTGCEFFIIQGKAYFRKPPVSASPIMTLQLKGGLLAARAGMRGEKLVKEVQVSGINPENGEAVTGKAASKGKFSTGSSAAKSIDSTVRSFFDERVASAQEAGDRAKILMAELQQDFMVVRCTCLGIPDLVPGRFVKLKGLDPALDRSWYICGVRHTVDERGFVTNFEARTDSL